MSAAGEREEARGAALRALAILDTPREERFDRIARLAATTLGAPIALIGFLDADRQWFKASHGLELTSCSLEDSFCVHTAAADAPLVVPDATRDERFAENPFVTGAPHVRSYAGHPVRTAAGEVIGTLCVFTAAPRSLGSEQLAALGDLARLVELELGAERVAELEALGRMQDAFIRLASHELRTPLTSVRGFAELLWEDRASLSERHARAVDAILRNADRLELLADDLLLVLRLESGHVDLRPEPVDVAALVGEAVSAGRTAAGPAGVAVDAAIGAAELEAHPRLLRRAVSGLIDHAVHASPPGSVVEVAASRDADLVRISVHSAGPGLTPEELERISRPFARTAGPAAQQGAGLDLTIARGVASAHGGRLTLRSPETGGLLATLELPVDLSPAG